MGRIHLSKTMLIDGNGKFASISGNGDRMASARVRLAREIFDGHYLPGQSLVFRQIAEEYALDEDTVAKAFAELQTIGLVSVPGNSSAIVESQQPKDMQETYEIRAALEEIAGRTAADALKGNVSGLLQELEGMRSAVRERDIDALVNHDIAFHRAILKASQNHFLLPLWNSLSFDLRMPALIQEVSEDARMYVESHGPIVHALEQGRGRQAGVLLRNHVETCCEYIRQSKSDSGIHKAIQKDLEKARDVQKALFPRQTLSIPFLTCETYYQPAHEVGGDYYDFLSLQGARWGIAIGDVSGKGVGAALVMASLQASLRAQALNPNVGLPSLIANVNRLVFESSPSNFFASLFYAEYEPESRLLRYVNAGHNPPVVIRPRQGVGELFRLEATSTPVGIGLDQQFLSATFQLKMDDLLVAYTDGITETENPSRELWGQEKLESLLQSHAENTPKEIVRTILDEVTGFTNRQPQKDDMTLVVIRVQ